MATDYEPKLRLEEHAGHCIRAIPHFTFSIGAEMIPSMHLRRSSSVASSAPFHEEAPEVVPASRQRSARSAAGCARNGASESRSDAESAATQRTRRSLLVAAPTAAAAVGVLLDARPAEAIKEVDTPDGRRVQARASAGQAFVRHSGSQWRLSSMMFWAGIYSGTVGTGRIRSVCIAVPEAKQCFSRRVTYKVTGLRRVCA